MTRSFLEILRLVLYAAWRRRYLLVVPVLVMLPVGILASALAPKNYEAKTILLLQETSKDNPFLKEYAVGLNIKERISALQVLLKSDHVLIKVLQDIGKSEEIRDPRELALETRKLASNISLLLIGNDLIELKLKGKKPEGLGKVLAAISARFLERLLSPEQSTLGATQGFLKDQMELRRRALEGAEHRYADFKVRNAAHLQALQLTNVTRLAAMQQRLQEKIMELSTASTSALDIRNQLASSSPIISKLEESIVQTTGELTMLKARYTDQHSDVQAAERRLERLQDERRSYLEVASTVSKMDLDGLWSNATASPELKNAPPLLVSQLMRLHEAYSKRAALEADVQQLRTAVAALQSDVAQNAPIEQEQTRLEKDVSIAREAYELFTKRFDNASTSRALGLFEAPERIKVIDAPQDPTIPVTPPPLIFVAAGLVAGMVLGIGLTVVSELLDQRLRSASDFASSSGVKVIARLPMGLRAGDAAASG